ncbi:MAG: hypothetical protein C4539_07805 [Ignavibacteriales bacterium]|nr:MAG: hypothetical protein C4539_07805 [Ignavibacteriales bacterium]
MKNLRINNKIILQSLLVSLISLILTGCANQLPPGGGPQDKTPPEITFVYPSNGTVNFSDDHFEIEFSEYVTKSTVQEAVFISPAIESTLDYDWSGTSVKIMLPGKLKDNVTYIVTIGTNVEDINNRNKISQSYSFAFSTGPKIDRGIVQGKVYADKPQGIMLFAYPVADTVINPIIHKPKYISQAGVNGEFKLLGLAFDTYRIFAVKDEFNDLVYNVGDDSYGCPYADISVDEADSVFHGLNFFMSKEDTAKPRLLSATMTDRFHILIEFSEPFDSSIVSAKNFVVIDSTENKIYNPVFAFTGKAKENSMVLSIKDSMKKDNNNFLQVSGLKDKNGNTTPKDFSQIVVSEKADTSAPNTMQTKVVNVESLKGFQQEFIFTFDDGFDSLKAKAGITAGERRGKDIKCSVSFIDDASFKVKILDELNQKENYIIKINLNNIIDAAGNRRDSVYTYGFKPVSQTDITGASGSVQLTAGLEKEKVIVVLNGTDGSKKNYQKKIDIKKEFKFDKVAPGKYLLWSYVDKDSSNTFNYGKPFPFLNSEKFIYYPDTLRLRARWPVEDIKLEYK